MAPPSYDQLRLGPTDPVDIPFCHVEALLRIIGQYNAQHLIKLKQIHRHFDIPDEHILYRFCKSPSALYRIEPTHFQRVSSDNLSPCGFLVSSGSLVPYEYCESRTFDTIEPNTDCLREIVQYIEKEGLERLFGIETIFPSCSDMVEFVYDSGCLLIPGENLLLQSVDDAVLQDTDWRLLGLNNCLLEYKGETRCFRYPDGSHPRVTDSKPGWEWALQALKERGVVSATTM